MGNGTPELVYTGAAKPSSWGEMAKGFVKDKIIDEHSPHAHERKILNRITRFAEGPEDAVVTKLARRLKPTIDRHAYRLGVAQTVGEVTVVVAAIAGATWIIKKQFPTLQQADRSVVSPVVTPSARREGTVTRPLTDIRLATPNRAALRDEITKDAAYWAQIEARLAGERTVRDKVRESFADMYEYALRESGGDIHNLHADDMRRLTEAALASMRVDPKFAQLWLQTNNLEELLSWALRATASGEKPSNYSPIKVSNHIEALMRTLLTNKFPLDIAYGLLSGLFHQTPDTSATAVVIMHNIDLLERHASGVPLPELFDRAAVKEYFTDSLSQLRTYLDKNFSSPH